MVQSLIYEAEDSSPAGGVTPTVFMDFLASFLPRALTPFTTFSCIKLKHMAISAMPIRMYMEHSTNLVLTGASPALGSVASWATASPGTWNHWWDHWDDSRESCRISLASVLMTVILLTGYAGMRDRHVSRAQLNRKYVQGTVCWFSQTKSAKVNSLMKVVIFSQNA